MDAVRLSVQQRAAELATKAELREKAYRACRRSTQNLSLYQEALEAGHNPYEEIYNTSSFFL